jgi:hypothetical protein
MKKAFALFALVFAFVSLLPIQQAFAQDGALRQAQDGAWGEVVDSDGNIMYDQMTDQGVVTQNAEWMPSITLPVVGTVSMPAEYHSYVTESGNTVLMPTATTLFFMAANASESGYLAAASTMGTGGPSVGLDAATGVAGIGAVWGAMMNNSGGAEMMAAIQQAGFNGPTAASDFFQSVANGQTNIWSVTPSGLMNFLSSFAYQSALDGNVYTYMLMYTPGQCGSTPAGCSTSQLDLLAATLPTPPPPTAAAIAPPSKPTCPAPSVKPGAISASASKTAPPYPLVVGQDPDRRGVDVEFTASVAPTIYTYYTTIPIYEERCRTVLGVEQCTNVVVGYTCQAHSRSYPECIASASAAMSLSQESREWILNELSIRYPEAYLHHPNFGFSGGGCVYSASQDRVPVADPGNWNLRISGTTSGTAVSGPRSFSRGGTFEVWLKEVVIIK